MRETNNFNLTIPEGGDNVNILTQITPNFETIDGIMKDNENTGVQVATELYSNNIHAITRTKDDASVMRFTATSRFTLGDTFTVDGVQVTALAPSGEQLPDGSFIVGSEVLAILKGTLLTVFAGAKASDSAKLNGQSASFYSTKTEVDNAQNLAEGATTIAENANKLAQSAINRLDNLKIISGFINNHPNARYKKIGKLVFVNGIIIVNGNSVSFNLPYTPVERVVFPTVGVSSNLSSSSIFTGFGDCRSGNNSCTINLSGANTYAIVNFVYETN